MRLASWMRVCSFLRIKVASRRVGARPNDQHQKITSARRISPSQKASSKRGRNTVPSSDRRTRRLLLTCCRPRCRRLVTPRKTGPLLWPDKGAFKSTTKVRRAPVVTQPPIVDAWSGRRRLAPVSTGSSRCVGEPTDFQEHSEECNDLAPRSAVGTAVKAHSRCCSFSLA